MQASSVSGVNSEISVNSVNIVNSVNSVNIINHSITLFFEFIETPMVIYIKRTLAHFTRDIALR